MVTYAAFYFLNEKIQKFDVIAVVGAFAGVLLMNLNKTDSLKFEVDDNLVIIGITL